MKNRQESIFPYVMRDFSQFPPLYILTLHEKMHRWANNLVIPPLPKECWAVLPDQPAYQTKKWKSRITFECLFRFGWNFAWKFLKRIYINGIKKNLAEKSFTALPNQPKLVLIEIFWKFVKFRFFSLKLPQTIAFKHNLKKNIVILILSLP